MKTENKKNKQPESKTEREKEEEVEARWAREKMSGHTQEQQTGQT